MQRLRTPKESALVSKAGIWQKYPLEKLQHLTPRKRQKLEIIQRGQKVQAVLQQDRRRPENAKNADAASRPEARHQTSATTAAADTYIPLNQAQGLLNEVVDASSPSKPVLLWFCDSGQQVLFSGSWFTFISILALSTVKDNLQPCDRHAAA